MGYSRSADARGSSMDHRHRGNIAQQSGLVPKPAGYHDVPCFSLCLCQRKNRTSNIFALDFLNSLVQKRHLLSLLVTLEEFPRPLVPHHLSLYRYKLQIVFILYKLYYVFYLIIQYWLVAILLCHTGRTPDR